MVRTKNNQEIVIPLEDKMTFNDYFLTEVDCSTDDAEHVYLLEQEVAILYNGKYMKFSDLEFPILLNDEVDLNIIGNPKMAEYLAAIWLAPEVEALGYNFRGIEQNNVKGSNMGYASLLYDKDGTVQRRSSDIYVNESVRLLNLITKLKGTDHLYNFSKFDYDIKKVVKRR